ncbi:MAG: 50S ribosomal protein L25 [Ignavibacteriae bacterium]|nr:50S ribosomal protein L25 [Ignavibacteria bacterium]MBI3365221.1 50S ribosomal protein L25 [Ignavibacteriota bacterium]
MREVTLQAEVRNQIGRRSRALRRDGKVPGIFYIHGEKNIPITVPEKSLKPLIYTSETHLINLTLNNGDTKSCILRDMQFDPVTDRTIHFDLQGLREDEEISIEVPIAITGGIPVGVRDGGILQHFVHKLRIFCLPRHIPDHVEVNAGELKINHFIHVRDLKIENVTIEEDEDTTIVGVIPPTVEKEETPAAAPAEGLVEPEVIGKGKKPEEGAEGEAGSEKKAEPAPPVKEEKKKEEKKK